MAGIAFLGRTLDLHGSRSAVLAEHHHLVEVFLGLLVVGLGCALLLPRRRASDRGHLAHGAVAR